MFYSLKIYFGVLIITQKRADRYSRLFVKSYSLHHHRLLVAVWKCEQKPSVIVDGDAVNGGAETAVLPFGVEEVKLHKRKEESAELIRNGGKDTV